MHMVLQVVHDSYEHGGPNPYACRHAYDIK